MANLLLETLKDADLEQYFTSFSENGITHLESLAQLSMQDYSSLGVVSIADRKKLFQLVQRLRQQLPTLENGLVSSLATSISSHPASATPPLSATRIAIPSNAATNSTAPPSPIVTNAKTTQSYRRRVPDTSVVGSKAGSPVSGIPEPSNLTTTSRRSNISQSPQLPVATIASSPSNIATPPTRSRSRTLPDQAPRPDFLKSNGRKASGGPLPPQTTDRYSGNVDNFESSEEEEKCEVRRGSGPLLDSYGIPVANKGRTGTSSQRSNPFSMIPNLATSPAVPSNLGNNAPTTQSDLNQKIRVCVRKRPLNKKELERGEKDISPTSGVRSINVNEPKTKLDLTKYIEQHSFTFDDVFDSNASNEEVYQRTARPLVKYIFGGGKATCFAYGQTGSGKTFTMLHPEHGLYVLAARDIFNFLRQPEYSNLTAWIGFYEIYQGQLYDLLNNRKKLFAREDGKQNVVIVGLKEYVIRNVDDLMQVFQYGSQARSTGSTGANSDSSRSHAILQILLRPLKSRKKIIGKLSFIDLAGSERGADRGDADTKTRMEGAEINKSLLALKECIRALDQDKRHTPFRQSKLTQVLKDSFVGNSRTCMVATISPNQSNSEHTLNTLRYADRVKELKGERDKRVVNSDNPNDELQRRRSATDVDEEAYQDDFDEADSFGSDDPDLYNEGDEDDLFLDDEYFPSDSDVNILDEDFPHENNHRYFREPQMRHPHASSRRQVYSTGGLVQTRTRPSADTPSNLPARSHDSSGGSININNRQQLGVSRGRENSFDQSSLKAASSPETTFDSLDFSRGRHDSGPASHYSQRKFSTDSTHRSQSASSDNEFSMMPTTQQAQHNQHVQRSQQFQQQALDVMDDDFVFDTQTIEDFIKYHRAEIRQVAENAKKETKLLANISLSITSLKELQEAGAKTKQDDIRMSGEFIVYLDRLDQILEMKSGAIEALRDRIRQVLGEDDL